MLSEAPVTLYSVWLLGVALGLTACTVTCLPFMGTWAMGRESNAKSNLYDTLSFLLGRWVSYATLGALAGGLGSWFVKEVTAGIGNLAIGISALIAAIWLAWPQREESSCAAKSKMGGAPPFFIGIALTLIPCAPLATLLATCAAARDPWSGALYGAAFGAGALLTPMLVLIPAAGGIARVLRQHAGWLAPWIRYGAALVLIALGGNRLVLFNQLVAVALMSSAVLVALIAHLRDQQTRKKQRAVIPIVQI